MNIDDVPRADGLGAKPRVQGPYTADQIQSGDPYELSNGWLIECPPAGGLDSGSSVLGAAVVGSDPTVTESGVDTGYSPNPKVLRAPNVAVGNVPDTPGWVQGAPHLAIEYACADRDEAKLAAKIEDLLAMGTKLLWVVRLDDPRRVEVHRRGEPTRVAWPGEHLEAPGILKNPVLVESLYDRAAAEQATLTNLLQRQGYASLEAVRAAGRDEGALLAMRDALRRVLSRLGLSPNAVYDARIEACANLAVLERWLEAAITASSVAEALT